MINQSNDSVHTTEPSASTTDVIIAKTLPNSNSKTRTTGYKSKRWAKWEEEMLLKALNDGKLLSEIKLLLSDRTDNAVLKRARDFDFRSNKIADHTYFSKNVNRRNVNCEVINDTVPEGNKEEQSIEATDVQYILHKIINMSKSHKEIIYKVIDATRGIS